MDRCPRGAFKSNQCVPRPRGDGPDRLDVQHAAVACSPPARGWTADRRLRLGSSFVFPARAGMDRLRTRSPRIPQRVPRPRGDGPTMWGGRLRLISCSPPARGWTDYPREQHRTNPVFPARAGMDRRRSRRAARPRSVPRPRGDGPYISPSGSPTRECSPPARGWTGDRRRDRAAVLVFPARAGMDRRREYRRGPGRRVPRPRGDGPAITVASYSSGECSPPARGWTDAYLSHMSSNPVFPARAGMDRSRRVARRGEVSVPRPRGDGPPAGATTTQSPTCSPPARGWTALGAGAGGGKGVFPARAGMDRRDSGSSPLW